MSFPEILGPGYYQTIKINGVAQPVRGTLNLVAGTGITLVAADDSTNNQTTITISSP